MLWPLFLLTRKLYWATLGKVETRATGSGRLARICTLSPNVFSVTINTGPWEKSNPVTNRHILKSEAEVLKNRTQSYADDRPGNFLRYMDAAYVPHKGDGEATWSFHIISRRDLALFKAETEDKDEIFWLKWGRLAKLSRRAGVTRVNENNDLCLPATQNHLPPINNLSRDGTEDITVCCLFDGHGGPELSSLLSRTLGAVLVSALADLGEDAKDEVKAKEQLSRTTYENAGACVTAVLIDQKYGKMYCINLGDCRAVAGWWNPETKLWRCDRLSDIGDMRCDNDYIRVNKVSAMGYSAELINRRTRDEHSDQNPTDVIIDRGSTHRLLGKCQLTRAMGDNEYKRDPEEMRRFEQLFGFTYAWPFKAVVHPLYMSHDPEIIVRDLEPNSGEQLKFLVLATDGLWDGISDEEAVLLTSARTEGYVRSTVSKKTLPSLYQQFQPDVLRAWPMDDLPGTTKKTSNGTWSFKKDDTPATHLIRNAIGDGDPWLMRRFLSMELGLTRRVRDDVTAMVLRFGKED